MDEDPVERAWQRVEERWEDPAAHQAFLGLCVQLGRMPEAGRRYREVRERDPERSEEARRRIDELFTLAVKNMEHTRSEPAPARARRRLLWIAFGMSLFMILFVLWTWLGPG